MNPSNTPGACETTESSSIASQPPPKPCLKASAWRQVSPSTDRNSGPERAPFMCEAMSSEAIASDEPGRRTHAPCEPGTP